MSKNITAYYTRLHGEPKLSSVSPPACDATLCTLSYLNEGGANLVFRLDSDSGLPPELQGRLLRLRKNLKHVQSAQEQSQAFSRHFRSLFPGDHVVEQELIQLDKGLFDILNKNLECFDRPAHRREDLLPQHERYGLLITDMSPDIDDILLELKPKWLAQSPNAPVNARRCRTCALRAQRASRGIVTATDAQASCPLALVSEQLQDRTRAATSNTTDERLQEYLSNCAQPLLLGLRAQQQSLDTGGVLNASDADTVFNVCKAMTLRDCTLFVKRSGDQIEARLGDLDMKQPERLEKWKQVEQGLINEGWYADSEDQSSMVEEDVCLLSR